MTSYRHYAWPSSPYSAKTRSYLQFKGLEFEEIVPSARLLRGPIKKAVGRAVMPTMQRPDGSWMQDSSEIIDSLEPILPGPAITPPGPTQRLANLLLELHADEWLPMAALHYRWHRPVNTEFATNEFARCAMPWLPRFVARPLVRPTARRLAGYLPMLGVDEQTIPGVESSTERLIAALDVHLADHHFVFGGRPALADFSLFGPLWSHLFRDPGTTAMFDDRPHVRAWFERLLHPEAPGEFLVDDGVPATLDPIFEVLFAEQFPFVLRLADAIDRWCAENPDATRVPRSLGLAPFTIGGHGGHRKLLTFSWWMAQRPLDAHAASPASPEWLQRVGGLEGMQRPIVNRFERVDFRMRLAK